MLAFGDLLSLVVAYTLTYIVADATAPPAVDAPWWVLLTLGIAAGPIWIALFTAYHLYDHDSHRISVASFDKVGDIFHALIAGSLAFLLLAQVLRRRPIGGSTARSRLRSSSPQRS